MKFYLSSEAHERGVHPLSTPRDGDAGYDIRSMEEKDVAPGEQTLVHTGLHLQIPEGWVGLFRDRSSLAKKRIYVHSGVIDSAYRGEAIVIVENGGTEVFHLNINDKIVQMIVVPHYSEIAEEVTSLENLGETIRGGEGFGSTGLK